MFCLDSFLTNYLVFTKTIIILALMASESIAYSAFGLLIQLLTLSPFGLEEWLLYVGINKKGNKIGDKFYTT